MGALAELVDGTAGEHRGTRRCAAWRGGKAVAEERAFTSNAVEVWCVDDFVAVDTGVWVGPIVGQTVEDVRVIGGFCEQRQEECDGEDGLQETVHRYSFTESDTLALDISANELPFVFIFDNNDSRTPFRQVAIYENGQ